MKQAIAVSALLMQFSQQVVTVMQCGAQRLIERGHARRLEKEGRAVYQDSSAGTQARQKQQGHPEVPFSLRVIMYSGAAVDASAVSAISGDTVDAGTVKAVGCDTVIVSAVSAVSSYAITAGTIGTIFGDTVDAGTVKTISGDAVAQGALCAVCGKNIAGQAGCKQGSDQVLVHLGVLGRVG